MKYIVSIPITGFCAVEVEASNTKGAIAAAWKAIDDGTKGEVEWEYTEKVTSGNVCHAMQNDIEVTRLRDEQAAQVSRPDGDSDGQ